MDINKIQKLNQMANNLARHNIVNDRQTAVQSAARIYGSEHNYTDNTVHYDDDSNELRKDVRKVTFALRDAIQEIKDLKEQVGKLSRELNDVRVNNKPRVVEKIVERPIQQPVIEKQQPVKEVQQPLQTEKKLTTPIDRNNVAPADVSIEKMFYCGEK